MIRADYRLLATDYRLLTLNRQQEWLFESFRNPAQEAGRVSAINQAVIVRKRERQHQPRFKLISHPHRLRTRTRKAEYGDFGMVHDGRECGPPYAAEIRDGKCAAFHFFWRELLIASLLRKLR